MVGHFSIYMESNVGLFSIYIYISIAGLFPPSIYHERVLATGRYNRNVGLFSIYTGLFYYTGLLYMRVRALLTLTHSPDTYCADGNECAGSGDAAGATGQAHTQKS